MEVVMYYGLICGFQFGMCFLKRKWLRFLPMMLFTACALLNGGIWLLSIILAREDSLGFPAALLTIMGTAQFVAASLGWGIFTFIQYIQKQRNFFVM